MADILSKSTGHKVLQSRRTPRLEGYVVILILVEILLSLVQLVMVTRTRRIGLQPVTATSAPEILRKR